MSRQPPPPPPPYFPEPSHTRSTNTSQNVTRDSAYPQGGSAPGHVHPPQMSNPTDYPSQQYPPSQSLPTPSRRSTVATTPAYDHASLSPHPPARPPLSGSTSYNPSFPVPERHPSHPGGPPPPPAASPIMHRAATMPMPHPNTASSVPYEMRPPNTTSSVPYEMRPPNTTSSVPYEMRPPNTTSSVPYDMRPPNTASSPYDMRPPNTMHSHSQPGIPGGPQSAASGYNYLDVHERDHDSSNFGDEDLERSRGGTRNSGEYMRDRSPPNRNSAGRQQGGYGGNNVRRPRPQQPELLRCTCGRVSTRADAEHRRWYCTGGHAGQWHLAS